MQLLHEGNSNEIFIVLLSLDTRVKITRSKHFYSMKLGCVPSKLNVIKSIFIRTYNNNDWMNIRDQIFLKC